MFTNICYIIWRGDFILLHLRFFADKIGRLKRNPAVWIPATVLYWLMPVFYVAELESFHHYPKYYLLEYLPDHIPVTIFGLVLMYVLFAAGFFLLKKAWANIALCNVLVLAVSLVNYIKYALTGENFMPHDIIMAENLGEITGFVAIELEYWIVFFFAASFFSAVLLGTFAKDAPRFYIRLPIAAVFFAVVFAFFGNPTVSGEWFNSIGMYFESTDDQSINYDVNGFIGGFSINAASFAIQKPKGYSAARLMETLAKYPEVMPKEDFVSPDIILVLSESFWDPRLLPGSVFWPNIFENYDYWSIQENAFAGKLLVPAYGGGTIRTEFEILTGLSCDALPDGVVPYTILKKSMESYVSHYKELGYDTLAIHPYLGKFYRRHIGLPMLGFDDYLAESLSDIWEVPREVVSESYNYVTDECFVLYLKHFLRETEKNEAPPLFLFGISIENHQPYYYKYPWAYFTVGTLNPYLSKLDFHYFENFVQGIKNADIALGKLCEFVDGRKRPAVLVFFGDHLPAIGTKYSAYIDTEFITDIYATHSRTRLYSTSFLIYANFPIDKKNLAGETFGAYDLLNVLSSLIGSGKTPYMGYLDALRAELPYFNSKLRMKITPSQREMLDIQYYETYRRMTE